MKAVGLVGLGKMGGGMARRLVKAGIAVHGYDPDEATRSSLASQGVEVYDSLELLVPALPTPRVVWVMVPADKVESVIGQLLPLLSADDVIIDGGNSRFTDSQTQAEIIADHKVHFLDVGVSGGVRGEEGGYALMVGGDQEIYTRCQPIFLALAATGALAHVGPVGAGHFVKMVHNAIEYGMMQAIAEGFDLLRHGPYKELDVANVATLWSQGTIIRSFLMELTAQALTRDPSLKDLAAYVDDSGEGRWSVETDIDHAVPFWVNTAALYARFDSRQPDLYAAKLVAALRKEFGGHATRSAPGS